MPSFRKYDTKHGKKWLFKLELGIDPATGKRRNTTRRGFKSKPEAEKACRSLQNQLDYGSANQEANILFKDFAQKWLKIYESTGKVKPQTIVVRKIQMKRLTQHFGRMKVKDISFAKYQAFIIDLKNVHGLSKSSVSGIHSLAKMIFKMAKKHHIIFIDPTDDVEMPGYEVTVEKIDKITNKYFEKDELVTFLETAKKTSYKDMYNFFLTLAWTGLRLGELMALKWSDVDMDSCEIKISKTYVNSLGTTSLPKTKSSIRIISIEQEVIDAFNDQKELIDECKSKYPHEFKDHDLVFPRLRLKKKGYPYYERYITYAMEKIMKETKIKKHLTPHSLRHTHVSLMAEAGVQLEDTKTRVGHKSDRITEDIYRHVTKKKRRDMSYKFGILMRDDD